MRGDKRAQIAGFAAHDLVAQQIIADRMDQCLTHLDLLQRIAFGAGIVQLIAQVKAHHDRAQSGRLEHVHTFGRLDALGVLQGRGHDHIQLARQHRSHTGGVRVDRVQLDAGDVVFWRVPPTFVDLKNGLRVRGA